LLTLEEGENALAYFPVENRHILYFCLPRKATNTFFIGSLEKVIGAFLKAVEKKW
jgi:hypothetical protein